MIFKETFYKVDTSIKQTFFWKDIFLCLCCIEVLLFNLPIILFFCFENSYTFLCKKNWKKWRCLQKKTYLKQLCTNPSRIFILISCMKSDRIPSFSGPYLPPFGLNTERYFYFPYSVLMQENTDQKNFEYGYFSRSEELGILCYTV